MTRTTVLVAGCATLLWTGTIYAASHAKLLVANNGVDSGTCGPTTPCRSITQAITNASAGDTIIVGPGLYGDLNNDGTVGNSLGEETPSGGTMINVNKTLTIESRDGAGSTVLDTNNDPNVNDVLDIAATGVVIGKSGHGLTLRHSVINVVDVLANGATVVGNILEPTAPLVVYATAGVYVQPGVMATVVKGNAVRNGTLAGVADFGTNTVIKGNLLHDNTNGLYLNGTGAIVTSNVIVNNTFGVNIQITTTPTSLTPVASFTKNAVVANLYGGVFVNAGGSFTGNVAVALSGNDYFGNGEVGPPTNCGVVAYMNDSNMHTLTVTSTKDFWGAPTGPGADPADNAGGACSDAASGAITENVVSPAAKEIKVAPPAIR